MKTATISILLRNNKPNRDGLCPVILKIIKNRTPKVITLGFMCLEKDWDKVRSQFKKSAPNASQRNLILSNEKQKALKIIDEFRTENEDFTLIQFENKFKDRSDVTITVKTFFEEKIKDLKLENRIGSSKTYRDTYNSFFKFTKNSQLMFRDITPGVLSKYETYMRSTSSQDGGIGVRMRTLKALYNQAIKKGVIDKKYYPFNEFKTSKYKSKGIKKALTREEINRIEKLDESLYPHLIQSKKLFIFSYYTRGMNYTDLMSLRWSDINKGYIHYKRSKTKNNFKIELLEPALKILEDYKGKKINTDYVFPILLKENMTSQQIHNRKTKTLRKYNCDLKEIAKITEINVPVTSYVVRHSYATNLLQAGVSVEHISQSMGHSNVNITSSYLKEFSTDELDKVNKKLLLDP